MSFSIIFGFYFLFFEKEALMFLAATNYKERMTTNNFSTVSVCEKNV